MNELQCRALYREAFSDPDNTFENKLFAHCFCYCRTREIQGETLSMLFALPCTVSGKSQMYEAYYVYAVATKREHRRKGHAAALLADLKREGRPLFLIPADEPLRRYYQKLGFVDCPPAADPSTGFTATPTDGFARLVQSEPLESAPPRSILFYGGQTPLPAPLYFPYGME